MATASWMAMTSLNISLPEVLKAYVEGQVASGDWGTPSEYIRDLIRQDKERRMANLEQELLAAEGPKIEVSISEIRRKGLVAARFRLCMPLECLASPIGSRSGARGPSFSFGRSGRPWECLCRLRAMSKFP